MRLGPDTNLLFSHEEEPTQEQNRAVYPPFPLWSMVFKSKQARIIMLDIPFSEGFYLLFIPAKADVRYDTNHGIIRNVIRILLHMEMQRREPVPLDKFGQCSCKNAVQKAVRNLRPAEAQCFCYSTGLSINTDPECWIPCHAASHFTAKWLNATSQKKRTKWSPARKGFVRMC